MQTIPLTLRAELAKLNDAQIVSLLGEILEPSIHSPFDGQSEELSDILFSVTETYCDAFKAVQSFLNPEPDSYPWHQEDRDEADRKYFQEYTA